MREAGSFIFYDKQNKAHVQSQKIQSFLFGVVSLSLKSISIIFYVYRSQWTCRRRRRQQILLRCLQKYKKKLFFLIAHKSEIFFYIHTLYEIHKKYRNGLSFFLSPREMGGWADEEGARKQI